MVHMVDVLKRGALVARSPSAFETVGCLTREEQDALSYEKAHKWSHPKALYMTIIICSVGAAVQ